MIQGIDPKTAGQAAYWRPKARTNHRIPTLLVARWAGIVGGALKK